MPSCTNFDLLNMESETANKTVTENGSNNLFPVFIKLEHLKLLIIGGGEIALEKLNAVLSNAPATPIRLVASQVDPEIRLLAETFSNLDWEERPYTSKDIEQASLVIAAVNDLDVAKQIYEDAQGLQKLVNIADKPEYCDFYLGSVVKKGHLKIAISTNGKSPTIAKRLKETFAATVPDELDEVIQNMSVIRDKLSGDLSYKVKVLNEVTKGLVESPDERLAEFAAETPDAAEIVETKELVKKVQRRANWYLLALGIALVIGLSIFALYEFGVMGDLLQFLAKDSHIFYWMLLAGFIAEIVAGSMGMGYGVMCTTTLLMLNIPPPVVSASIHSAESFTTAAGSLSHWKLGNVNKKMTWALAVPAIFGAIAGALLLSYLGERYARITKPFIAAYTLYLGIKILTNALRHKPRAATRKKTNITMLGLIGGFIDSFGGGGWGPLVTGTFIKNGRTPRYVVGSSTVAKFILTVTSAVTFVFTIGIHHWNIVAGLLIGGIVTAPFSAMLTSKLPTKKMFVVVGIVVITMSFITIYRAIFL